MLYAVISGQREDTRAPWDLIFWGRPCNFDLWVVPGNPALLEWKFPRRADGSPRRQQLVYQPLDYANFEARYLKILRDDFDPLAPIVCCELVSAPDTHPPEYVALSYCWGDPKVTAPVVINGTLVQVTANLEAALRQLRSRGYLKVWADALCINQGDLRERSEQVRRMGQIYQKADKVISWLGGGPRAGEAGNRNPGLIYASRRAFMPLTHSSKLRIEHDRRRRLGLSGHDLEALSNNPYWRRIWIIQEVSKAREIEVWYGQHQYSLDDLLDLCIEENAFTQQVGQTSLLAVQYFRDKERQSRRAVARMLLSEALVRSRWSLATNPRDKIYALRSMTRDGEDIVPNPNYKQSPRNVFKDVTRSMITNQGQHAIMLLAGQRHNAQPSWLPNWSHLGNVPLWIRSCVLQEREILDISTLATEDTIRVKCTHVDSVGLTFGCDFKSSIGSVQYLDHDRDLFSYADTMAVLLELWDALTMGSYPAKRRKDGKRLTPDTYYDNKANRQKAFALVALCLCTSDSGTPTVLEKWYGAYKYIWLYGATLERWIESHFENALRRQWKKGPHLPWNRWQRAERLQDMCRQMYDVESAAVRDGLNRMAKNRMEVVITRLSRIAVVYEGACVDDLICRLENCYLPVLLRFCGYKQGNVACTLVGEVLLPDFRTCDCVDRGCGKLPLYNWKPHTSQNVWIV